MVRRAAGLLVLAVGLAACVGSPAPGRPATIPAKSSPATPAAPTATETGWHVPAAGEHWESGDLLALPCPVDGAASTATLLRAGRAAAAVPHYAEPTLSLRPGGSIDVTDGVLGIAGLEWIAGIDYQTSPGERTTTAVPRGRHPVTIAELTDGPSGEPGDFAAAEVRLSDTRPVRWVKRGFAGTDIAQAAWFSPSGRARVEDAGYDPMTEQMDGHGRTMFEVVIVWAVPCYFLDVAPRETGEAHDVVVVITQGDGGFPQYIGYDAAGHPAAAVLLGYVPWKALGLPGTRAR